MREKQLIDNLKVKLETLKIKARIDILNVQ